MAQTFEEIAEILKQMQLRSDLSIENLDKSLSEINLKLAEISEDEAVEAVKIYISEFKNLVEEKFNSSTVKINNLENVLNDIINSNSELAKKTELAELFESFSINFKKFLTETSDRKVILDNISEKLDVIHEKAFNKDEVISQIKQVSEELSAQMNSIPIKMLFDGTDQKITELQNIAQNLQNEFYQNATVTVENTSKLSDGLYEISNKLASMLDLLDEIATRIRNEEE